MEDGKANDLDALRELVDDIEVTMLTTLNEEGQFFSRPLQTQRITDEGILWFLTRRMSRKVDQINANPAVCLTYASREQNKYVSVYGIAQEITDRQKIEEMWSLANHVFFPDGKDDPEVTLLRITVERAECWVGPSTVVGKIFAFAKAAMTGDAHSLGAKRDFTV